MKDQQMLLYAGLLRRGMVHELEQSVTYDGVMLL